MTSATSFKVGSLLLNATMGSNRLMRVLHGFISCTVALGDAEVLVNLLLLRASWPLVSAIGSFL